jgi:hypothetical protein
MMHKLEKQLLEAKAKRRILSGEVICVPQTTQEQKFVHFQVLFCGTSQICVLRNIMLRTLLHNT